MNFVDKPPLDDLDHQTLQTWPGTRSPPSSYIGCIFFYVMDSYIELTLVDLAQAQCVEASYGD